VFNGLTHQTELLRLHGAVAVIELGLAVQQRIRREERHKRHTLEKLGVRKDIPAPKEESS
jgi:hypothetical protein